MSYFNIVSQSDESTVVAEYTPQSQRSEAYQSEADLENEFIRLTIDSLGAEMVSAVDLATGSEMIWCADPAVWNRHAPILFPYAGKLTGGHFKAEDGKIYAGGQHGFARDMEHMLSASGPDFLTFRLGWNGETLALWPWKFSLETTHRLEGDSVVTVCRVQNEDSRPMPFQLGFHTALRCPSRRERPRPTTSCALSGRNPPCGSAATKTGSPPARRPPSSPASPPSRSHPGSSTTTASA